MVLLRLVLVLLIDGSLLYRKFVNLEPVLKKLRIGQSIVTYYMTDSLATIPLLEMDPACPMLDSPIDATSPRNVNITVRKENWRYLAHTWTT